MKYAVSGRQPKSVLQQADEIKMMYQDRERLIDYIEELSDKTFILEIPKEVQKERSIKRNGAEMWKRFETEWIPKELAYFENLLKK